VCACVYIAARSVCGVSRLGVRPHCDHIQAVSAREPAQRGEATICTDVWYRGVATYVCGMLGGTAGPHLRSGGRTAAPSGCTSARAPWPARRDTVARRKRIQGDTYALVWPMSVFLETPRPKLLLRESCRAVPQHYAVSRRQRTRDRAVNL
jgi:hypothetical protein